jgi:hypothetical protein
MTVSHRNEIQQKEISADPRYISLVNVDKLENENLASHIQYVMDNVVPLSPANGIYIFAHWGSCGEVLEYLNNTCCPRNL